MPTCSVQSLQRSALVSTCSQSSLWRWRGGWTESGQNKQKPGTLLDQPMGKPDVQHDSQCIL